MRKYYLQKVFRMKKLATMTLVIVCVLTGICKAQYGGLLGLQADAVIIMSPFTGLFREGTDVSKVEQTFAGPACAKGRVIPEFEDFFDGTGIILEPKYSGIGSVEYDARKIEGLQSTKLNVGGDSSSYFTCNISPTLNWKHKSIKFRFYIPPADHNIEHVDIRLSSGGIQYNYAIWDISRRSPRTEWIEYTFTPTNGYNTGDLAALDCITIGLIRQNNEQPAYILVNGLTVWDGRLKMPLYCCTFDDNNVRQYEAAMYAMSRGIPISLFINKNYSDGISVAGSVGMTLAQNQALEKAGCIHINHGVSHSPPKNRGDGVTDLWSNPETPIADLIADIEDNRKWMNENGLGFGAGIFGSPREWWLPLHEQHLKPYIFGRPRQGMGMGNYGLLTMWDENTEIRAACDTYLTRAYTMLAYNVGTAENNYEDGDRAIQIDVWHQYADGSPSGVYEGSLQDFKDYIDVVAAHIAAGRLRAVDLRELYENYLYTTKPANAIPGDLNFDGVVNLDDFVIMSENWLVEKEN